MPSPYVASISALAEVAKKSSTEFFEHWHNLNSILDRFESVIRNRWLKKTPKQRKAILLTAWPGMSTSHYPKTPAFSCYELSDFPPDIRWSFQGPQENRSRAA